ncbi:egg cell-secreted protein 1.4-like [Benincasa hispida]|uniref:egg cell-secreted protein 1.4-like n=1 Tax=Benincasa hispida TaxID=102211 RepID=UPI001900145E|nr:egg cell-secreted protein 1.4-like [Benincasa hispida]
MASIFKLFLAMSFLALTFKVMVESRPNPKTSLTSELMVNGEISDCWGSLYDLQACTGEVITFFLNGETYLGSNCCQAIKIIQHECWPTLLGSLGYTTEEGDVLEAYCDTTIDTDISTMSSLQLAMAPSIKQKNEPKIFAP